MSELRFSSAAELALFGNGTPLFQRYRYFNRLFKDSKSCLDLTPITDVQEALVLLYEGMNDGTRRFIAMKGRLPDGTRGPVVRIEIYGSGYGHDEFSKAHDFPIAQEVLDELQRSGVLSGRKHWGYTDNNELSLNDRSTERIWEEIRKYAEAHPPTAAEAAAKPDN